MGDSKSLDLLTVVKTGDCDKVKFLLKQQGLMKNNAPNNYLALIEAVKAQNLNIVRLLINYGCMKEERKADVFYTALDYSFENTKILTVLLKAGASTSGKDFKGKTPLIRAMEKKNLAAVHSMLSLYKVDNIVPDNKNEVIHFCIACIRNNKDLVEKFIEKQINVNVILDNYIEDWYKFTPLYLAIKNMSMEVVEILIKNGASFISEYQIYSSLHQAYYLWADKSQSEVRRNKASCMIEMLFKAENAFVKNRTDFNRISYFYIACVTNNVTAVKNYILNKVDLKVNGAPLHLAVEHNCYEVVNFLLEYGFYIDSKDSNGKTALHVALDSKHCKIAEFLLKSGADILTKDIKGYTPIHKAFINFMDTGDLLDYMLAEYKKLGESKLMNMKSPENLSFFHIACTKFDFSLIEKFLSECSIDVNDNVITSGSEYKNFLWYGFSALHFATCVKNFKVIQLLLKNNANINATDKKGVTALWYALHCQPKYCRVSEFVREKFKEELTMLETYSENQDVVKQIIIDSIIEHFDHIKILKLLLESGSDVNYKNADSNPLLFKAYQSVVSCLINESVDSKDIVYQICHDYFLHNAREIMKLLISYGINCNPRNGKDSIFHFIIDSMTSHDKISKIAIECADLLISKGGNPTLVNGKGESPLIMAVKCGQLEFLKLLVKYNIDINSINEKQMTPLHIAVQRHWKFSKGESYNYCFGIINFLISNGADINARDVDGQTPLFESLKDEASETMKLLLEAKCDINAQDKSGRTVLLKAASEHNIRAMKVLLKYGADLKNVNNSHIDLFNFEALHEILIQRMKKLMLIRYPLDCKNIDCLKHYKIQIFESAKDPVFYKEVKLLEESKLDPYTSLYDILHKNVQQMTKHVKNTIFQDLINSDKLKRDFPNYGYILTLKYQQGLARNQVLQKANESLKLIAKCKVLQYYKRYCSLHDSCVDSIFDYLTNEDLKNLSRIDE